MMWHDIHVKHAMDGTILDIGGLPKKSYENSQIVK
jgi:hypothetical protein